MKVPRLIGFALVGAALLAPVIDAAISDAASSSRTHLVRDPIAIYDPATIGDGYGFTVYVRLDRALPKTTTVDGVLNAGALLLDGAAGTPVLTMSKRHHCYTVQVDDNYHYSKRLKHPRNGLKVRLTILLGGREKPIVRTVRLEPGKLEVGVLDAERPYKKRLGC